jgi:hypothetical protein
MSQIGAFKKLQRKLEFHRNKCHPGNAHDTRRQCTKAIDQWAQRVASRVHLAASCGLASRARSSGGGTKEFEVRSQWKRDSVATRSCG